MALFTDLLDLIVHFDRHLAAIIEAYGVWTYGLLFAVIFAETGLVFVPFLPGDSLLFAGGAFAGRGSLSVALLVTLLSAAAILGDTANYWIGKYLGERFLRGATGRWINQKHLDQTHAFFEKYGAKTIVIARFVPIVRTMAPFVAGIGVMTYGTFLLYNVVGGLLWVSLCVSAGYLFGELPVVKDNFFLVILAIIAISVAPIVIEYLKARRLMRSQSARGGQ